MRAKDEDELAKALKEGCKSIEIEGSLAEGVIRIKAVGPIAWGVLASFTAIGLVWANGQQRGPAGGGAVVAGIAATGVAGAGALALLGTAAAKTAFVLATSAGGAAVLSALRGYELIKNGPESVTLRRLP